MTDVKSKHLESVEIVSGESRLRDLYRQLPVEEPSADTDAAIVEAARQAVSSSHSGAAPFSSNWYHFASLAAVLVMCVGVVTMLVDESGEPVLGPMRVDEAPGFPSKPPATAESVPAPADLEESTRQHPIQMPSAAVIGGAVTKSSPPMSSKRNELEDRPAPAAVFDSLDAGIYRQQTERKAAETDRAVETHGRTHSVAEKDAATAVTSAASPRRSAASLPSEPASDAVGERRYLKNELDDNARAAAAEKAAIKTDSLEAPATEAAIAAPERSPEEWLLVIRRLRENGRWDEAEQSLEQFRRAFPEYPESRVAEILGTQ